MDLVVRENFELTVWIPTEDVDLKNTSTTPHNKSTTTDSLKTFEESTKITRRIKPLVTCRAFC